MPLTQKGLVFSVGATESRQYQDKTFVSRVLILEQPRFDNYTGERLSSNYIKFEADREETCRLLDSYPVGSKVEIEFIVKGTKFSKRDGSGDDIFTHLVIRSVALAGNAQAAPAGGASGIPSPGPAAAPAPAPAPAPAQGDYDPDLGF